MNICVNDDEIILIKIAIDVINSMMNQKIQINCLLLLSLKVKNVEYRSCSFVQKIIKFFKRDATK